MQIPNDHTADYDKPVSRLRFHGLRKLNWVLRPEDSDYLEHLADTRLDQWIEPGPITIIVGPNAGGKSTVIDLLRALGDTRLWPTLPRENYPGADFSGFDIEGSPTYSLSARFLKYTPQPEDLLEMGTMVIIGEHNRIPQIEQILVPKYFSKGEWQEAIQKILDHVIRFHVHYLPATGERPAKDLDDEYLVELLNELSPHFPSVLANKQVSPFQIFKGSGSGYGRIGVLFKDDTSQHAIVHRSTLPLGWLQIASLLGFLRQCQPGSLILLDEPDIHLHASLQRVMLEVIELERQRLKAQLVMATHSSVLCNPELCTRVGAKVVVAARGRCEVLEDARQVLDDLGVTSGDLVQANGIIWVEGPSDRIYVKNWIELFAKATGQYPPIERVHYTFVCYGGALLKHLSLADTTSERVDIRSINRNYVIIIDRDLPDNTQQELGAEKQRLLSEAEKLESSQAIWITKHYTIESYLPRRWPSFDRFVQTNMQGKVIVKGISKVELATRFKREITSWKDSYLKVSDLEGADSETIF